MDSLSIIRLLEITAFKAQQWQMQIENCFGWIVSALNILFPIFVYKNVRNSHFVLHRSKLEADFSWIVDLILVYQPSWKIHSLFCGNVNFHVLAIISFIQVEGESVSSTVKVYCFQFIDLFLCTSTVEVHCWEFTECTCSPSFCSLQAREDRG